MNHIIGIASYGFFEIVLPLTLIALTALCPLHHSKETIRANDLRAQSAGPRSIEVGGAVRDSGGQQRDSDAPSGASGEAPASESAESETDPHATADIQPETEGANPGGR
jgi:hypothetical protein